LAHQWGETMEPETKSNGSLVGLVVIVIILVVGVIYIWMSNKKTIEQPVTPLTNTNTVTNQDSSDLNALEQDSNATDANTGVDYNAIN